MSTFRSTVASTIGSVCLILASAPTVDAQGGSAGKARFVEVQNLYGFSGFFNLGQGTVRIVAVLSPSCPECRDAYAEIQRIMEETPNKRLRAFLVYSPGPEQQERSVAFDLAGRFHDRRVAHVWDPTNAVLGAVATVSELGEDNPHGCLLFDTNAVIKDDATTTVAMQMSIHPGDAHTPFDGAALEARANELLAVLATQKPDAARRPAGEKK